MTNGIEVNGTEAVAQSLQDFADAVGKQEQTFLKIGGILVEEAKSIVPVRTHKLQGSIVAKATDNSVTITAGNNAVEYAGVIHRRRAYLTIAQYNKEDEVAQVMAKAIDGLIKQHFE
jgi:hypothetical protein